MNCRNIVYINYSYTFLNRCICKHCGHGPEMYIAFRSIKKNIDPSIVNKYIDYLKKNHINDKPYLIFDNPHKVGFFSYPLNFKGYDSSLHHKFESSSMGNLEEMLICRCGETLWKFKFSSKSLLEAAKNSNRFYPNKFE